MGLRPDSRGFLNRPLTPNWEPETEMCGTVLNEKQQRAKDPVRDQYNLFRSPRCN
jgi:hypothetical protein